jgi:hypothetical protein
LRADLSVTEAGLPLDGKMEALVGYDVHFFFNDTETTMLNSSYDGSVLLIESTKINSCLNFTNYVDMLCYASLVKWRRQDYPMANYYFNESLKTGGGKGFEDSAFNAAEGFETYKLGLFYLVSKTLGRDFEFKKDLTETIWSCQVGNGGFKTYYFNKGNPNPDSKANIETTSIVLLVNVPLSANN